MVGYCYICKTEAGEESNVSFHRLPKNEEKISESRSLAICTEYISYEYTIKKHTHTVLRYYILFLYFRKNTKSTFSNTNTDEDKDNKNIKTEPSVASEDEAYEFTERSDTELYTNVISNAAHETTNIEGTAIDFGIVKDEHLSISDTELYTNEISNVAHETTNTEGTAIDFEIVKDEHLSTSDTKLYTSATSDVTHETTNIGETIIDNGIVKYEYQKRNDTELCTSVTSDVERESINSEKTVIDDEIARDEQLKRKIGQPESNKKRLLTPRYVGDIRREDFTSNDTWYIFQEYLTKTKSKMKQLDDKVRYLNTKVGNLQEMMDDLKKRGLFSRDALDLIKNYKLTARRPNSKGKRKTNKKFPQSNCE
ncbi:uncharacterized protein LOC112454152 [Temnothorax curvispinosus]|uniref:Uncharacterized protein LOC112454152 n=1 Tax=Temnothorax curvispinosus TaxID=300111 RepID=A0A6J1PPC3_9HYME|nr:uncharacterized protein LOC112454152 [Temnothorax curvispinosus]